MGGRKMNLGTRILVMGLTDSGKSRFISEMCKYFSWSSKGSTPPVKSGLNLDIRHVKEFPFTTDKGDRVTLVDTPGFDNTTSAFSRSSVENLTSRLLLWLRRSGIMVIGLLDKGSQAFPYDDGSPTGTDVIQYFCDRKQPVLFDFQKEAVDHGAVRRARGTLRKEKQLLKTQIATLNDALSEKEKAINDLQAEKQLFEAQVNDLNDNLREKDQVNTELRKSIETGRKSLENEIIELRSAVREKEEVVNRLQITLIQEKKLYVDQNA
ncbi:hypothetical protein BDV41DRAFT_575619 [Aspergillus transmontanensis]|uniref:Uncharacterized protein n=1 Tax=Aspergillus transmontanensis TaxID=1034304 RepID=A0A5N6W1L4_9EURO|nr:hypothetical protein BDV41DRAFT_575619 [Aspergillus transmontanensis]